MGKLSTSPLPLVFQFFCALVAQHNDFRSAGIIRFRFLLLGIQIGLLAAFGNSIVLRFNRVIHDISV